MCQTHLALPNPRGQKSDYVDGIGLTEGQWEALRPLQGGQGLFLLVQGTSSAVVQLPMGGKAMERFVRVLSARESDLRAAPITSPAPARDADALALPYPEAAE